MQAGDSTRQRLEHVCHGLYLAGEAAPGSVAAESAAAGVICALEGLQLKDAQREFDRDVGVIMALLSAILGDAIGVVASLCGGQDSEQSSFLARIKDLLAQASTLIGTCESAGKAVDDALAVVEDALGKFRNAIASLSEAVVDIALIANELETTVDQVSVGTA